jgi:hypothetical protein
LPFGQPLNFERYRIYGLYELAEGAVETESSPRQRFVRGHSGGAPRAELSPEPSGDECHDPGDTASDRKQKKVVLAQCAVKDMRKHPDLRRDWILLVPFPYVRRYPRFRAPGRIRRLGLSGLGLATSRLRQLSGDATIERGIDSLVLIFQRQRR